jgi:two-component system sensor histidine kinase HydH
MTRTSVLGPEGEDLGSSAILRDVTEQRRMEQRMVAQERMSALGELAAALAHEIRNPLNSMVITTEVVRGRLRELTAAHRATLERYLEVISSEIRRLDKVVERVLTYAKPIEGKFERVALKPILVHVADLLSVTAKSQRIRLRLHVDDDLPSIEGVSDHLIQILVNLVLNALQATPRGGTVTLVGKRGEFNTVVLSVADTGIGIPKANYRKIFDLHFSTKKKGSGLGLPLVKRLVTAHSGTLTFTSRVRHGTTFTLTFPQS